MLNFGFLLATVVLLLRPQEFVPGMAALPVLQIVIALPLLAWSASTTKRLDIPPIRWLLAFLVLAMFGMGMNGWWGGGLDVLNKMLPSIAFFLLAFAATRDLKALKRFLWVIGLSCMVLVFHGWQQRTYGVGFTGEEAIQEVRIRYIGILNDPNDLGLLFNMAIVGSGYLYSTAKAKLARLTSLGFIAILLYGIYLTDSRGSMLATMTAAVYVLYRVRGKAAVISTLSVVLPVLWAATRLSTISSEEASAEGRIDAWREGLFMLRESPLFGVGYGGFADNNFGLTAHNSIILPLAELGIPGYVCWFSFCATCAVMCWKAANSDNARDDGSQRQAAQAIFIMGLAFFVGAMFLSQSYKPMIFIVCGLAAARGVACFNTVESLAAVGVLPSAGRTVKWALLSIPITWLGIKILSVV